MIKIYKIRDGKFEDIESFENLQASYKPETEKPEAETIFSGGQGFVRWDKEWDKESEYIQLVQIFVNRSARKQGVATKLLNELKKIAKKEKITTIYAHSSADKDNPFYWWCKKVGFNFTKESDKFHSLFQWKLNL